MPVQIACWEKNINPSLQNEFGKRNADRYDPKAMAQHSADQIRESLEQRIIEREFANGERLDETRLADFYGVSRTPLREALRLLAGSGLVQLIQSRGAFVRYPGAAEVAEMFAVMAELEAFCGRLAARRISTAELMEVTIAAGSCERALDEESPDDYFHANEEFHALIRRAAGNGFLAAEAADLHRRLRPFRRMQLRVPGRIQQSMAEHFAILAALRAGDPVSAAEELRRHVVVQADRFNDLLANIEPVSARNRTRAGVTN